MTLQEMYNKAKARIAGTGRCTVGNSCRYRDGQGAACAVGALILDEHYTPECDNAGNMAVVAVMEGEWRPVPYTADLTAPPHPGRAALATALNRSGVPATEDVRRFLSRLQSAHDRAHDTAEALRRMAEVAESYDLTP